jgi:hypothetical protein
MITFSASIVNARNILCTNCQCKDASDRCDPQAPSTTSAGFGQVQTFVQQPTVRPANSKVYIIHKVVQGTANVPGGEKPSTPNPRWMIPVCTRSSSSSRCHAVPWDDMSARSNHRYINTPLPHAICECVCLEPRSSSGQRVSPSPDGMWT